VLPIGTFAFVLLTNPGFYLDATSDPMFFPGMIAIVAWYSIGMLMIRKLVDLKV
jgi:Flp pilus assembly protein TadB